MCAQAGPPTGIEKACRGLKGDAMEGLLAPAPGDAGVVSVTTPPAAASSAPRWYMMERLSSSSSATSLEGQATDTKSVFIASLIIKHNSRHVIGWRRTQDA